MARIVEPLDDSILDGIRDAVANLDVDKVLKLCSEGLNQGIPANEIVIRGLSRGLEIMGQKYEKGELFVTDLILAGENAKEAMALLEPHLIADKDRPGTKTRAKVVIGTVQGDLHDLGKNLTATLLKAAGFEVVDLGKDVPPKRFREEVERTGPKILGMSALLTTTMVFMEDTIRDLEKNNIRKSVKVIIGGAPVDSHFAAKIGADAAAKDALEGVEICKGWSQQFSIPTQHAIR